MTSTIAITALLGVLGAPLATDATPPKDMSTDYRAECGSCHVAYPPNLLADGGLFSEKAGWKEIMDGLRTHYGENAELDDQVRRQLRRYLVDNAGSSDRRYGSSSNPPRLTNTLWFRRTHGKVKSYFEDVRVGSPANCQACHPRAEHSRYAKEDIVLPKLPRR
jgi:hypothetical protein